MKDWQNLLDLARPAADEFAAATKDPVAAQEQILRQIMRKNADTSFGQEHGFSDIASVEQFRKNVPVRDYEQFRPYVDRMVEGDASVLTCELPVAFDVTSGSSSKPKLIPYTPSGIAAFRNALMAWLADLGQSHPAITKGKFYWALSPATGDGYETASGIPVGPLNDVMFFGEDAAPSLMALSCTPADLSLETDLETWRTRTLCHMISAPDLSLISIWSPTFLIALLDYLQEQPEKIIRALDEGQFGVTANPARAELLTTALEGGRLDTSLIWPQLALISCWGDAGAKRFLPQLQQAFPQVKIQGKGLMSTEAMVSIPLQEMPHPALALTSGFFEFLGKDGTAFTCNELVSGNEYTIVVTTPGGLYRYNTGDLVRVAEPMGLVPTFEFIGKAGTLSDMCGEKLSEAFVLECLGDVDFFAMVVPIHQPRPHYAIIVDIEEQKNRSVDALLQDIETALCTNPHYAYAQRIGQLGDLRTVPVTQPLQRYLMLAGKTAPRLGSIKPPLLSVREDWHNVLESWREA